MRGSVLGLLVLVAVGCGKRADDPSSAGKVGFSSRLAADCAGDETYDACQRLEGEVAVQSWDCQKSNDIESEQKHCDRVPARLKAVRTRLAALTEARQRTDEKQWKEQRAADEHAGQVRSETMRHEYEAKKKREAWILGFKDKCLRELSTRVCAEAPEGTPEEWVARCPKDCSWGIDIAITNAFNSAKTACMTRYTEASGKGSFTCDVHFPETADLKGEALAARVGTCSADCVKDGPAALARAKEAARAAQQAPDIIRAYKRCMVEADSTPTARKFDAYDHDLYIDLLEKANASCRRSGKCDWIEKLEVGECGYAH